MNNSLSGGSLQEILLEVVLSVDHASAKKIKEMVFQIIFHFGNVLIKGNEVSLIGQAGLTVSNGYSIDTTKD